MSVSKNPSVSIIIPTYNEVDNIEAVVEKFLASEYSNLLEILIIDGHSTDGTQDKVIGLSHNYSKVRLLENPRRIQSAALNIGLEACQGDIFLRADAHCNYAPDYVEQCVAALQGSQAINVGGAQRFIAANTFQAGVALASRSLLGSGGAKYRDPHYNGYAETVFLGCFWRSALESIGGYEVTRKEDSELNFRLQKIKGDRAIYISSKIKVWYFPRRNWLSLWRQYVKYGRGSCIISARYADKLPLRNKIPFFGLLLVIIALITDFTLLNGSLHTIPIIILGLCIIALEAGRITLKYKSVFRDEFWYHRQKPVPSLVSRWLCCTIAIATMPIAHFTGFGYQLYLREIVGNKDNCFFESRSSIPKHNSRVKAKMEA
ncbi:glycosyltransferase family 2 protein [Pleurocapsa sp. PCC 7319]|uniref:glycosyltransferase family 2 protein n=1 Tax=Pleurocapsa sp. PCC 7319 TaxID=118161 RepID=UPI00034C235D|nr:glycosyltransferase family 2 protein [Pleurocapsa sp. PCC 7319]